MHLFSGPVDIDAYEITAKTAAADGTSPRVSMAELEQRIDDLEAEVAKLKRHLD